MRKKGSTVAIFVQNGLSNFASISEPPVPEIYWEGVNSTSIAISVNNTFGFDKWSATIVDDVGTTDSPDYSSASDKHYFT